MIEVLERSLSPDLARLDEVLARIAPEESGAGALLAGLITSASGLLEAAIGRPLLRARYRETQELPGGRRHLVVNRPPVSRDELVAPGELALGRTDLGAGLLSFGTDLPTETAVEFWGGWVSPALVVAWAPTTAVELGRWVAVPGSPWLMEATQGGTTSGAQPAWPGERGGTITDGSVTWTAREAEVVPRALQDLCYVAVFAAWERLDRSPELVSRRADAFSETYQTSRELAELPGNVLAGAARWRLPHAA